MVYNLKNTFLAFFLHSRSLCEVDLFVHASEVCKFLAGLSRGTKVATLCAYRIVDVDSAFPAVLWRSSKGLT